MSYIEKRIKAFAIDSSLAFIFMLVYLFLPINGLLKGYLSLITIIIVFFGIYFISSGQTFGKRIENTKVVNIDGSDATIIKLIARDVFKLFLSLLTGGIYLIICTLFSNDKNGQVIHDYIFRTVVVDLSVKNKKSYGCDIF